MNISGQRLPFVCQSTEHGRTVLLSRDWYIWPEACIEHSQNMATICKRHVNDDETRFFMAVFVQSLTEYTENPCFISRCWNVTVYYKLQWYTSALLIESKVSLEKFILTWFSFSLKKWIWYNRYEFKCLTLIE